MSDPWELSTVMQSADKDQFHENGRLSIKEQMETGYMRDQVVDCHTERINLTFYSLLT